MIDNRTHELGTILGLEAAASRTGFPPCVSDDNQGTSDGALLKALVLSSDLSLFRAVAFVAVFETIYDATNPGHPLRNLHLLTVRQSSLINLFRDAFFRRYSSTLNSREVSLSNIRFVFLVPTASERSGEGIFPSKNGTCYQLADYRDLAERVVASPDLREMVLASALTDHLLTGAFAARYSKG